MSHAKSFTDVRFVRLNARLMPINHVEARFYRHFGITPVEVEAFTPGELIPHVADCDALAVVSASLPDGVVDALSNCRLISRLGTGIDKIAVATATRKGILVSNVPHFCVNEMADHVMAVLLTLSRQIPRMSQHMRRGAYQQAHDEAVKLTRISGQTLGLVGFGASAKAVAMRARPFGLNVLATRRDTSASRGDADALGVRMVDLDTLLKESDFVSLHLPLTAETRHMLNRAAFKKMKPGACLINTSRGALVDEDALADVLESGLLAGAGLDTFDVIDIWGETESPPDHPLARLDNVIVTPHVSGLSAQAVQEVAVTGIQNLVSVLNGHLPHPDNIVNRAVAPRFTLAAHDPDIVKEITA